MKKIFLLLFVLIVFQAQNSMAQKLQIFAGFNTNAILEGSSTIGGEINIDYKLY